MSSRCFFGLATEEDGSRVLAVRTGEGNGDSDCTFTLTPAKALVIDVAQRVGTRKPLRVVIPAGQSMGDFGAFLDQLFTLAGDEEELEE